MWVNLWLIDTLWILYNLALKSTIEMRMLACRKTLMISYREFMRHQWAYKRFLSTILVSEKCYRSTTIVNPCFSTTIADPDPKTMAECKMRSYWNKWKEVIEAELNSLKKRKVFTEVAECKMRSYWNKWKEAIEAELNSLKKRKVFTEVIPTPPKIFPIGFKWVLIQKRNENNEVVRYKARLNT
jgi:hypothetical protein